MTLTIRRCAALLSLALAAALMAAGSASATTIATGVLTGSNGQPVAGKVAVYASPPQTGRFPLLGVGRANGDGRFRVKARNPEVLGQFVRGSGSSRIADFSAEAQTSSGQTGSYVYSGSVRGAGAGTRLLDTRAYARGDSSPPAPRFRIRIAPTPRSATASPHIILPICAWQRQKVLGTEQQWTVVGELNNAYREDDGTKGTFTYGRNQETSTHISVEGAAKGVNVGGEVYMGDSMTAAISDVQGRRWSRQFRTVFEYKLIGRKSICPGGGGYKRDEVRASRFLGGKDTSIKQSKTLDRCDPAVKPLRYAPGGFFDRTKGKASGWSGGVTAFGVGLTTRSGFNDSVSIRYDWSRKQDHYICGSDGRASPLTSGRVLSGAFGL